MRKRFRKEKTVMLLTTMTAPLPPHGRACWRHLRAQDLIKYVDSPSGRWRRHCRQRAVVEDQRHNVLELAACVCLSCILSYDLAVCSWYRSLHSRLPLLSTSQPWLDGIFPRRDSFLRVRRHTFHEPCVCCELSPSGMEALLFYGYVCEAAICLSLP